MIQHQKPNLGIAALVGSREFLALTQLGPKDFNGHRDAPHQILHRDPTLMNAAGTAASGLPGGHVEGFADTFLALLRQVYGDVVRGLRGPESTYASFEDGHYEMVFCDAVLLSAREGRWVQLSDAEKS